MTVTIADVAKHADVSKSTVSQYLNKRYTYMGEKTKERIEASIQELGYQPNIVARSLKQKSTKTIGVIVANILHTFTTEVTRAIEDYCHGEDFHTIICNADDDPVKERHYIEMLRAKQVDGLIIFPTGNNLSLYRQMKDASYPVVFLDRTITDVHIPTVSLDNRKASKLAVDHLVEEGYERIAVITTSILEHISTRIDRIEGYKEAMSNHGIAVSEDYIVSAEPQGLTDQLEELLRLDTPPDALLAGNDLVLIEILKYAKRKNLVIPDELALIGIDDVSFAGFYSPAITTVAQPTFKMGKKAAELLLNQITKKEIRESDLRFQPTLMIRDSLKKGKGDGDGK
ncbi:UNVERIFIED_CONTAM: substrate-binding domain-containing protein [Halobacillus marinus]